MTNRSLLTISLMILGAMPSHAAIYKIVDEDGNVSYTDVAPTEVQKQSSTAVEMNVVNTFKDPLNSVAADPLEDDAPAAEGYTALAIVAPADETSVRANAGNVTLRAQLTPALQPGHHVRFFLDGKPVGTVAAPSLTIENVDRGTHTVAAVVIDAQGKPLRDSQTTRFTLQRASVAKRAAPPPSTNSGP